MKAILVIDVPDDYYNEQWRNIDDFGVDYQVNMYVDFQPPIKVCEVKGVSLKPMPQKMSWGHTADYIDGYNACLDEILGETEL